MASFSPLTKKNFQISTHTNLSFKKVGHLPVLKPGQIFEYMSGCELTTPTGTMGGSFYMSRVSPQTKSCTIGDPMDMNMEHQFLMNVEPFALIADGGGGDLSN
mmetsp:Transcript_3277/g.4789  ORF Transcript_3277/g.4789 Transcript_3277/m.4789 type:complete len:103 (+) Transcript_3277:1347-1655(+)